MGRKSMKSLLLGKYQESQNCVTWSPIKFFYFLCLFDSSQMLNLPLLRSVLWPTEWDISTYKFMDLWISSRSIYQSNSQTGRGLDWNFSELKCGPNPFFAVLLSHFFTFLMCHDSSERAQKTVLILKTLSGECVFC